MDYKPYQITKSNEALAILKENPVVYIQGEPRSGKTATALRTADMSKITSWLILCPKQAIEGWTKFLVGLDLQHNYHVTNYEQVYKRVKGKYKPRLDTKDYKGLILDEAHNYGVLGRPSIRVKMTRLLAFNYPLILVSGTANAESLCSIYHQCYVSRWSPFKFPNFYKFHQKWGKPYYIKAGGRDINQYDKSKEGLIQEIQNFSVFITQEEAGMSIPIKDKLHYITLDPSTKTMYNTITKDKILEVGDKTLVCDSVMKERVSLHMLESGVLKIEEEYIYIGNTEKIDYIKKTFGDTEKVGIMCHFVGERELLSRLFTKATIYSSTTHAEGVDLSHLEHFVILSSSYSGAKFIQRRERVANINGTNTTTVHHILVKGAISEQVYKVGNKKLTFNNNNYKRILL